ncbi:MAG: PD40 domain-containing protein [Verrucomicrobia bacterium]|nr:PD40 domain-containing protein [Verrucomicrobiota bacterium]
MKSYWVLVLLGAVTAIDVIGSDDPLAVWRDGVKIRPVTTQAGRHTIHSYVNVCPESPDGRWVLFYTSTTPDSHRGELRILERATGQEKVLARNINTEDAHRAACQQWASRGKRVVYHDVRDGEWLVAAVDVESGKELVLARQRQLCWGQANSDLMPFYGQHWNPGTHRDLELVNVETGEITTAVTADAVRARYPELIAKLFGDKPMSVFFPIISPDLKRVMFKLASPGGGDFRSSKASTRLGLVCYDLENKRFLFATANWGHPAWHPDSRTIVQKGNYLMDSNTGSMRRIPDLPAFRGDHPTASPDGKLMVTDTTMEKFGGTDKEWGVAVSDMRGKNHVIIHRADNSRGAKSWRKSHPHPVFSPDGRRIYFNVSSGDWTQLFVAEAAVRH